MMNPYVDTLLHYPRFIPPVLIILAFVILLSIWLLCIIGCAIGCAGCAFWSYLRALWTNTWESSHGMVCPPGPIYEIIIAPLTFMGWVMTVCPGLGFLAGSVLAGIVILAVKCIGTDQSVYCAPAFYLGGIELLALGLILVIRIRQRVLWVRKINAFKDTLFKDLARRHIGVSMTKLLDDLPKQKMLIPPPMSTDW